MANQGPHNTSGYSSGQVPGQAQLRRNDPHYNQASNMQNQDHEINFLQETGTQISNMAQGAAEIGKGAALGAVSMAKGAAAGAANIAHGAADAVKNTFGVNTTDNTANCPSNINHPAGNPNCPTNTTNFPGNTHYPNPNTRNI